MIGDLYRQRAAECECMALSNPKESEHLREVAETWRWLAQASDELSRTVH
jgi:hypothetical protein